MYPAQPQPMYAQQQPMMMQQQPVYVQQQQPVYIQQPPQQQVFIQQPQPQAVYVQQQPVVQVVGMGGPQIQIGLGGALGGVPGGAAGPSTQSAREGTTKLLEELKKTNSCKLRYMDANFRGNGGFTFAVYLRGSSTQLATAYTSKQGEITLETPDKDDSFAIAEVANTSTKIYNPTTGQKELAGSVAFTEGSCGSWSFNAEKAGQKVLGLQNTQFNYCFACLCAPVYLISFFCCKNKSTLTYVNGEDDKIGTAIYNTDDIRSYREMEITFEDNGTSEARIFAILAAVAYFSKRVGTSIDRLKGMNDVEFSFQ